MSKDGTKKNFLHEKGGRRTMLECVSSTFMPLVAGCRESWTVSSGMRPTYFIKKSEPVCAVKSSYLVASMLCFISL